MPLGVDAAAVERVRALMGHIPGVVLTTPGSVAWATGGLNIPIDRTAATDVIWVAIGQQSATVITTNVEHARLAAECSAEVQLTSAAWWDAEAMVRTAAAAIGAEPSALGSDGYPAFGIDLTHPLTVARLHLTAGQQDAMIELGQEAAGAVEDALRAWRPGETDNAIAARIAAGIEAVGGQCPVLIVGGDDRVRAFRHPVAIGAPVERLAMAVLVASRAGQHVALTRFAASTPIDSRLRADMATAAAIQRDVLAACVPETTLGSVMTRLADAYARHGHADGWKAHYQGGPIGYAQREAEIAPVQTSSPWWDVALPAGCAVAFNPSLDGGAKDEDTFLLTSEGPRWITQTGMWPHDDASPIPRPAVLDIRN